MVVHTTSPMRQRYIGPCGHGPSNEYRPNQRYPDGEGLRRGYSSGRHYM